MSSTATDRSSLLADARLGLLDIWPAAVACVPIALLFGALAAGKGLSAAEVAVMGFFVFAGGAQFAAVELWATPAPIGAIVFSTLLINARHVLMSASLVPKLEGFTPVQKLLGLYWMADENWALGEKRARTRRLTPAYWFGMVVPFVTSFVSTLDPWRGDRRSPGRPAATGRGFRVHRPVHRPRRGLLERPRDLLDCRSIGPRFSIDLPAGSGRPGMSLAGALCRPRRRLARRRREGADEPARCVVTIDPINLARHFRHGRRHLSHPDCGAGTGRAAVPVGAGASRLRCHPARRSGRGDRAERAGHRLGRNRRSPDRGASPQPGCRCWRWCWWGWCRW